MDTEDTIHRGEQRNPIDIAIEQEVEEYKKRHGERWRSLLINNLHAYVPGGYRRSIDGDTREESETASEKRRSQSFAEFIAVIDHTLQEMGITDEVLREEKKKNDAGKESQFLDIMFELYTRLRKMGYNRYPDLTR